MPSTLAIGAMSHAPRHSNARTLLAVSPAAARSASYSASAPRSEQEMFVQTYTLWAADGVRLEHVVEGRERFQVGGRDAHHAGDLLEGLRRAPPVERLGGR